MISINLCNNKFYDAFLSLDSKKTGEKQRRGKRRSFVYKFALSNTVARNSTLVPRTDIVLERAFLAGWTGVVGMTRKFQNLNIPTYVPAI